MREHQTRAVDVLLVVADHWTRALLSAQLQEAGYDVIPMVSLHQALALLHGRVSPRLVILDCAGLREPESNLEALTRLTPAPLLVLVSAVGARPNLPSENKIHLLVRPFAISDVVENVKALLDSPAGASCDPSARSFHETLSCE